MWKGRRACIVSCFDTYSSRIELLTDSLKGLGLSVDVISSDYMHIKKAYRDECSNDEILIHVPPYKHNISFSRVLSHRQFAKLTAKSLYQSDYDLIWCLLPPNQLASQVSSWKKSHNNTKLVFDVIDMWPETMPYELVRQIGGFIGWGSMRNKALGNADLVVTECNLFADLLKDQGVSVPIETIWFSRESRNVESLGMPPTDQFGLCYLGSINHLVDIEAIADIIQRLSRFRPVTLHIIGAGERYEELATASTAAGASVVSHGAIYDWEEKQRVFDCCHYGLNIMRENVCVGLTMKSIDYLDAGLPLINNIKGDTWQLIERESIGFNYPSHLPCEKDILHNPEMRTSARKAFEKCFSREVFRQRIEECLALLACP